MLATSTSPPATTGATPHRRRLSLLRLASCGLIVGYIVLFFEPFAELYIPPGGVRSVLFPFACACVIVCTPWSRLGRIVISWVLATLLFWMTLSWFWSVLPYRTTFVVRSELVPLVLVVLVAGTMAPDLIVRTLRLTFIGVAVWTTISVLMLASARSYVPDITQGADRTVQVGLRGTFGHKNQMGIFMALGLALMLPLQRGRWKWYVVGLMVVLTIGTRSATAGSGLFALAFVGFWLVAIGNQRSARERTIFVLMSILTAIIAVLLVVGLLPTLLGLYEKDVTFSGRTIIWSAAMELWLRRPLQGYGLGALWTDGRSPATAELWSRIGFPAAHAHSGIIELGLQVGLVGVGLFIAFVVGLTGRAVRAMRDDATARYGAWAILTVAALLLMSISEPLFSGPYLGYLAIMWVVLASAQRSETPATPLW